MTEATKYFEAVMRGKGHTDFSKTAHGKYVSTTLQVRWAYFLMGWEMAKASGEVK